MTTDTDHDAAIDAFDALCRQLGGFDDRIDTEWADGYFTALLAGPRIVPVDEWLPAFAGDAFERAFADPEDAARAKGVLMARWREIADALDPQALLDDPDALRLSPILYRLDDDERQRLLDAGTIEADEAAALARHGQDWAAGFVQAIEDFDADWALPGSADDDTDAFFAQCLAAIGALLMDDAALAEHLRDAYDGKPLSRDELVDEACFAVQDLRLFWLDHGPRPEPRRVEPKPGRNDPCPCGSGRKFKKCHGAA